MTVMAIASATDGYALDGGAFAKTKGQTIALRPTKLMPQRTSGDVSMA
jgi:hypothetical protein